MKILHVSPYFMPARAYGGTVESLYRLCLNLARLGCDVRALATNTNGLRKSLDVQTGKEVAVAAGFEVTYSGRIARHSISPGLLLRLPVRNAPRRRRASDGGLLVHDVSRRYWRAGSLGKPLVWSPRGELQRWRGSRGRIPKRIWEIVCRLAAPRSTMLHVGSEAERGESLESLSKFRIDGDSQRGTSTGELQTGRLRRNLAARVHRTAASEERDREFARSLPHPEGPGRRIFAGDSRFRPETLHPIARAQNSPVRV